MELKIFSTVKADAGKLKLPAQFSEPVRSDLIKRAVLALQANKRQPYGADPRAGMDTSAKLSRRRRKYRGSYGAGISRVPRKIVSRRGTRMNWVGALAPGTVGGRRAHPPKADKLWVLKVNKKERRKAVRSALAATLVSDLVKGRGHFVPGDYPFVVDDKFESFAKTKDVLLSLQKLGFDEELERSQKKSVRAGKGKVRGRKYRKKKGLLLVVSDDCPLLKSAGNIPGVDVEVVSCLNAELLAPGAVPGRMTLFTKAAIGRLDKEKLFM